MREASGGSGRPGPGGVGAHLKDELLLETARSAAARAAEVHRESADRDTARWNEKGRSDFVTEVDTEAERRIVATLRDRFPSHRILAEEGAVPAEEKGAPAEEGRAAPPPSGVTWIVDPLDGTTNWLHGYPEYSVSVAALDGAGLRLGIVLNSATGERFEAVRDGGSRRNGTEIRVSGIGELRHALLGTGFPFKRGELLSDYLGMLGRAIGATAGVRRSGSAALDLCDLACGRLDGFWELWLQPWDVAAGILIVWEAGGDFGPLEGTESLRATTVRAEDGSPATPASTLLRETAEGARDFVAACRGERPLGEPRPGAYLGGNALLTSEVRALMLSRP